ncbi:Rab-like protein 2A, partial [Perkinsus olseni]
LSGPRIRYSLTTVSSHTPSRISRHLSQDWFSELRQHVEDVPAICVANKIDIDMTVTERNFAFPARHKLPFYFVCASNGTNVVKVFREALKLAVANKECPPDEV